MKYWCFSLNESIIRDSRKELLCKKIVLKNFTEITGTPVLESFLFKRLRHRCFTVNFATFLRISIFIEHLRWLVLYNNFIIEFLNQNVNTFSQWTYVELAWARLVKLFTCDYALDIAIVLLMLRYLLWHFDRVLMGCFEHVPSHCVLSLMPA